MLVLFIPEIIMKQVQHMIQDKVLTRNTLRVKAFVFYTLKFPLKENPRAINCIH
jgi:hypothetical protein